MTDEAELQRVERLLQRTPAPEAVPAAAAMAARNAALSEPAQVIRVSRTHRFSGWWRVASGAAALGAAAAAALVLALTSGGGSGAFATQFSVDLHGPQGATAEVDFSRPNDGLRQMRVTTTGLPPAGAGQYYEMWFRTPSGEKVSAVTFNTAGANRSSFTAVIPAGMTWHRCWVTREATNGASTPQMILTT